jgi:TPR repeat protein
MAQSQLGYSYQFEHGLPQDNTKAHMWLNIASANGDATAGSSRAELAAEMTPADIAKAQEMAHECMSSGYTKCGY